MVKKITSKVNIVGLMLLLASSLSTSYRHSHREHLAQMDKCFAEGTHEITMKRCCILPPFFANEVSRSCGAAGVMKEQHGGERAHYWRVNLECGEWACILDRYHLLTDEGDSVDLDRLYDHLDRWLRLNEEFREPLFRAKLVCKKLFSTAMPIQTCNYEDYNGCLRNYLNADCPVIIETEICRQQRDYYEGCREYLFSQMR